MRPAADKTFTNLGLLRQGTATQQQCKRQQHLPRSCQQHHLHWQSHQKPQWHYDPGKSQQRQPPTISWYVWSLLGLHQCLEWLTRRQFFNHQCWWAGAAVGFRVGSFVAGSDRWWQQLNCSNESSDRISRVWLRFFCCRSCLLLLSSWCWWLQSDAITCCCCHGRHSRWVEFQIFNSGWF